MPLPPDLLSLAARQHSVVARRQAVTILGEKRYDGLVRRGHLIKIDHGVVRVAGAEETPHSRMMAALLRAGDGARVTGPAVLGLYDIDGFTPDGPFEVLLPPGSRLRAARFPTRPDPLPGIDVVRIGALTVAGLPFGLIDATRWAEDYGDRAFRVALDSACWKGLTTRDAVVVRLDALSPRHGGARWYRRLDADGELRQESEQERRVARALAPVHPQPLRQQWVTSKIRVDFLWPDLTFVLEYNGWVDHGQASRKDRSRIRQIERLGHEVMVVGANDLQDPDDLAMRVQFRLIARARHLGRTLG